jgi:hypothetical protein
MVRITGFTTVRTQNKGVSRVSHAQKEPKSWAAEDSLKRRSRRQAFRLAMFAYI